MAYKIGSVLVILLIVIGISYWIGTQKNTDSVTSPIQTQDLPTVNRSQNEKSF